MTCMPKAPTPSSARARTKTPPRAASISSNLLAVTSGMVSVIQACPCTSQGLSIRSGHERGGDLLGPGRAATAGDAAARARRSALGQRDRRALRHHPAGGLPAPARAQGRGARRRPRGGPPTALRRAPGGPRVARGVPRRAVARRACSASRTPSSPAMAAEPLTASVHIEATPSASSSTSPRPRRSCAGWATTRCWTPTPGGAFEVDINGVPVRGRYLEVEPPHRLLISWGHAGSERLPPGASTVEVRLSPVGGGTQVEIVHRGPPRRPGRRVRARLAALHAAARDRRRRRRSRPRSAGRASRRSARAPRRSRRA